MSLQGLLWNAVHNRQSKRDFLGQPRSWNATKTVCRRWRLTDIHPGVPKHGERRDISEGDKPRQREARQGARTDNALSRFSAGCGTAPLSRLR